MALVFLLFPNPIIRTLSILPKLTPMFQSPPLRALGVSGTTGAHYSTWLYGTLKNSDALALAQSTWTMTRGMKGEEPSVLLTVLCHT